MLLPVALGMYSLGFLHAVLSVIQKKHSFFSAAMAAMTVGFICHVLAIGLRAAELRHFPLVQRADAFSFLAAMGVLGFFVAFAKYRIAPLSVFIFPLSFILTFLAVISADASSRIPDALLSNWIYVHTPLVLLGYAALFIAFSAAALYLIQERELKSKNKHGGFLNRLPSLEVCDDLAYRSLAIGFPLITLGFVSGALWAQTAWGTVWGRDLKVLLSLLTWMIYLVLIHYRLIAGWRGRKAAYLSIAGFAAILSTFVGASYFGGLHSFYQ